MLHPNYVVCAFAQEGVQASQDFTETDIADLFQQIVLERNHVPGGSLQEWAKVIMSATEGVKGLSGTVLAEVRHPCANTQYALCSRCLTW